ncbi:MAG: hypothetical protein GY711_15400 [bacterium]|nr:hypothetical protein [bacterium]
MKYVPGFIAALAAVAFLAPRAEAQVPSLDARVSINIVEQDLAQVVQHLRDRSGANIVIMEGGENKVRDLQITDVYWRDALEYAVQLAGCVVEEDKSGVLLVSQPTPVNFEFVNQDILQVIDAIGLTSGANIIVGPEVQGTLSVRLKDVPWRDALEEIVKTRGYTVVEEQRGILRVVDPLSLEKQKVSRIYQLRYVRPIGDRVPIMKSEFIDGGPKPPTAEVQDRFSVLDALRKALSSEGELDFIVGSNSIIVRDTTQVHETIQEILRRLDVEPAQVFVDVKFVSTTNTDLLNIGVDYGDAGPQISFSGSQIPIELPFDIGGGGFEDGFIAQDGNKGPFTDDRADNSVLIPDTIFGALSFNQWSGTLRLLQRDTKTEVIQAPKLITVDGNEATIFVGETVRYAEAKTEQGQAGGLSLTVAEAGGSPVEIGFQLLVRPNVIPGTKKIMMEVIPKETSLSGTAGNTTLAPAGFDIFTVGASGFEGSIALPRTRSSTLMTQMMLDSGQTAVIGGLTTESDTRIKTRVPYLSRIPLVGELFKHKSDSRDRRSLVIFITPKLVHTAEDSEYLLQQELRRRRTRIKDELMELEESARAQ